MLLFLPRSRFTHLLSVFSASALMACGGGPPPIDVDAGCGEPGVPADQPALLCPESIDLGCVGDEGAVLDYTTSAAACDGSTVTVSCDVPSGGSIAPLATGYVRCTATAPSGASASCVFPIERQIGGPPMLVCPPSETAACVFGGATVPLHAARVATSCDGGTLGPVVSDAPAMFVGGTTTVTHAAMISETEFATCEQQIVIIDTEAPVMTCPTAPQSIIRSELSEIIPNFAPTTISDNCDDRISINVSPRPTGRGTTPVIVTAADDAGNTTTCEAFLRVFDVFAVSNLRIAEASPVTLAWDALVDLDTEELGIERATAMAGPFTQLARIDATETSYVDASAGSERVFYRVVSYGPSTLRGGTSVVIAHPAL